MDDPDEHVDTLGIIAETSLGALAIQRSAIERLETKGAVLLGITLTVAQLTLLANDLILGWRLAALVVLAWAFLTGLVIVAPFKYADVLVPRILYLRYRSHTPGEVQNVLAATRVLAYEKNATVARRKQRAWWRTLILLVLGITLAGVASLGG